MYPQVHQVGIYPMPFPGQAYPQQGYQPPVPVLRPVYTDSNSTSSQAYSSTASSSTASVSSSHVQSEEVKKKASLLADYCLGIFNNPWYSMLHQLPTVQLPLDRMAKFQTQAKNGVLPRVFEGMEMISDFVAKTALKCAFFSLLILSAAVFVAGPLASFSVVTMLPVAMGFLVLGILAKIIASLSRMIKEGAVNASFASLLSPVDKQRLKDVKKWDEFTTTHQKHFADVEKQLEKVLKESDSIPREYRDETLRKILKQFEEEIIRIREFKSVKVGIGQRQDLSFTRRHLGIA